MKKATTLFLFIAAMFLYTLTAVAADLSRSETLDYIKDKLRRSNVQGVSGVPWFPDYDQPRTELNYWKWHMDGESVKLIAEVEGPEQKHEQKNYIHILEVTFDLQNIKKASSGNSRIRLYFDNDDLNWEVKKFKITKGKKELNFTKYDEDDTLQIHLHSKKDAQRLAKAFNYYVKNWGSRASRSDSRSGSREQDPFDD